MDPDPNSDPDPAIFVVDLQDANKNLFFKTIFSAYYFLKVNLHHFSKIKSQKESQNSRNQGYSYYFCMMIEGSGSGSGRPKNMWIRWIRIHNIGKKEHNALGRLLSLQMEETEDIQETHTFF
jgi:hypothetical protein